MKRFLLLSIFYISLISMVSAQPGDLPGNPPGPRPPRPPHGNPFIPIDGGLGYLLVAGLGYGIYALKKRKKS